MINKTAEQLTTEYMKPIFGFALKRTTNIQDANDLTQEICLKLYRSLRIREDIISVEKFVWTVAYNTLANYYRGKSKTFLGSIDDVSDSLVSGDVLTEDDIINSEMVNKLHKEIAYLSKMQRKIVILYYYSGTKQTEIAQLLHIPLGTVKWHLSEARSELKKGMNKMRESSELKFNPIKFELMGVNGSVGTMGGTHNFFRSSLSQNIAYCVWQEGKSINQIADALGVSPVYVETEAEFLEEYGFLLRQGNSYLANFLIDETTTEKFKLQSEMYEKAAKLFANDLFNELIKNELIESEGLYYPSNDKNFFMWSLIFYIGAISGETLMERKISFDEATTIRPDGGVNIAYASILDNDVIPPKHFESMKKWCGPCWNGTENTILWLIDTEWSDKRIDLDIYARYIERDLQLLERFANGEILSDEDYAFMVKKGYVSKKGDKFEFSMVRICDKDTKHKLIQIGDKIKEKHNDALKALKDEYIKGIIDATPRHLRKMQMFGLQYIFYADGWFLLYCAKELLNNGKLKLPNEEQRRSLTMMMLPNR